MFGSSYPNPKDNLRPGGIVEKELEADEEHGNKNFDPDQRISMRNRIAQRKHEKPKRRLEDCEIKEGNTSEPPDELHTPEIAKLDDKADSVFENDKAPAEVAEVEPATSDIENCTSDFETSAGKETNKKLDSLSKLRDMVSEISRSNKSTKGYDHNTGEVDPIRRFQEQSRSAAPFSLLGGDLSINYTLDLPELTYSTNNSSITSTIEPPRGSRYPYYGLDEEQTNKGKNTAQIMRGNIFVTKEDPLGLLHLDRIDHPSKLEESDDESQLNPFHHKISTCGEASASSTPYFPCHEREAHDIHGDTARNKILSESMSQLELKTESEPGTETGSDEVSEIESDFEIDDAKYTDLIWLRDILQHDFQQAQETEDGQTKQDFYLIKDYLICYILERFWSWSESRYRSNVTICAGTPPTSSGSSLCETGSSEKSSQSSRQGGKRKRQANSYNSEDKRQTKRVGTKAMKEKPGKEQLQFACPFRKHNPGKYSVIQWHYCALTSYSSIARLKEHLIRGPHRVWECDRCRRGFNREKEKINHAREKVPCSPSVEAYVEEEGIHPYHVEWLRAKGKGYSEIAGTSYSKQTEVERWNTIYKKLFSCSDDMLPSPYFEEPIEERARPFDSGDIGEFQQYFQEELSHDFRRRAAGSFTEDLINQASSIIEQCASNICTNFNERITKSSSCTQKLGNSSQGNPSQSPRSSSVPSLGVPMPTNNSNNQSMAPGENDTGDTESHIPNDIHLTMPILTPITFFSEIDPTSDKSCQDSTTQSQSLLQELPFQIVKIRGDTTYNGNNEDQSAQNVTHNCLNSVFRDDLGGGSVEDFITEISNENLDDGADYSGDINNGWNSYLANLDMDLNM